MERVSWIRHTVDAVDEYVGTVQRLNRTLWKRTVVRRERTGKSILWLAGASWFACAILLALGARALKSSSNPASWLNLQNRETHVPQRLRVSRSRRMMMIFQGGAFANVRSQRACPPWLVAPTVVATRPSPSKAPKFIFHPWIRLSSRERERERERDALSLSL